MSVTYKIKYNNTYYHIKAKEFVIVALISDIVFNTYFGWRRTYTLNDSDKAIIVEQGEDYTAQYRHFKSIFDKNGYTRSREIHKFRYVAEDLMYSLWELAYETEFDDPLFDEAAKFLNNLKEVYGDIYPYGDGKSPYLMKL